MTVLRTVLLICICVSLAVCAGCGKSGDSGGDNTEAGSGPDTGDDTEKKSPEKQKMLEVTLKAGDKTITLNDAHIRNNAMTPADDSHNYTVYADLTEGEGGLSLSFEYTEEGGTKDGFCTVKGYKIDSVSVKVEHLTWKKGTYGGKKVTSVKGSYSGKLRNQDKNGFPTGDPIDFSGTFEQ